MNELVDQILAHLRAMLRYRWYAVVIAWVIALGGWIYVYQIPPRYESFTRVFVDTKSVLRPLLMGLTVQPDLNEMVLMMSQTLASRPNLEKVAQMSGLDVGAKTPEDMGKLIASLKSSFSMSNAGRESPNMYVISFVHEDPVMAKRVVESLLSLFVERSHGDKREDADQARRFIDKQLEGYREELDASERTIMEFKRRNLNVLPGSGGQYYERLSSTKEQLRRVELELKEAEDAAASIRNQLVIVSRNPSADVTNVGNKVEPVTEIDARILTLEKKLDELRFQYTEQHPDIVAMERMMVSLQVRKAAEAELLIAQLEAGAKLRGEPQATIAQAADPLYQQLTVSLAEAEATVASMRARFSEHTRRYAELQAAANIVPQVEAEFVKLTRDHEVNKARYVQLLQRRESAEISGDLEESDAAMNFQVVDPPRLPYEPSGPTLISMISFVLLGALAGGIGIAWLISQLRPSINNEQRLKEVTGLPVLGTVIMGWTDAQRKRRNWRLVGFVASYASLLSVYGAIVTALVLTGSRA